MRRTIRPFPMAFTLLLSVAGATLLCAPPVTAVTPCPGVYMTIDIYSPDDRDGDGKNDSVEVFAHVYLSTPSPASGSIRASLTDASAIERSSAGPVNFSLAGANNQPFHPLLRLDINAPISHYTTTITLAQSGDGDCDTIAYSDDLFPLGDYQPILTGDTAAKVVNAGATVRWNLTLANGGTATAGYRVQTQRTLNWSGLIGLGDMGLDPGQSTSVWYETTAPAAVAPGSVERITFYVEAVGHTYSNTSVVLVASIPPQIFGVNLYGPQTVNVSAFAQTNVSLTLQNTGNNFDNISLSITSAPANWIFQLQPPTPRGLTAGQSSAVWFNVTPTDYVDPGFTFDITVRARSSDGVTFEEFVLTVVPTAPDLYVFTSDLVLAENPVFIGQQAELTVTVHNGGNWPATSVEVRLQDGLFGLSQNASLLANGTASVTFRWVPATGSRTVDVTLDPDSRIAEFNEANNHASLTFEVAASDLRVARDDVLLPSNITAGIRASAALTVWNLGSAAATSVRVLVAVDNETVLNSTVSTLAAFGGHATLNFSWTPSAVFDKLTVELDPDAAVSEINETNNVLSIEILVNTPPVAQLVLPGEARAREPTIITAQGSTDEDGWIVLYQFDFGDGKSTNWSSERSVAHSYASSGKFLVTVRARDDAGAEAAASANLSVGPALPSSDNSPKLPGFDAPAGAGALVALAILGLRGARRNRP